MSRTISNINKHLWIKKIKKNYCGIKRGNPTKEENVTVASVQFYMYVFDLYKHAILLISLLLESFLLLSLLDFDLALNLVRKKNEMPVMAKKLTGWYW